MLDAAGLPEPDVRQRRPADAAARRSAWPTRSTTRRPPSGTRRSTSRCSCNRGIYHQGWTAVTRHSTPWVIGAAAAGARRRRLGALRARRLDAGARPRRRAAREAGTSCSGCSSSRRRKYNVLPLDDRRVERFNADLAGRPQLIRGNRQLLFGGMGRLTENSVIVHQEQVPRGDGPDRRPRGRRRGRDRRPGRRVRRLEPVPQGRPAGLLLQPVRPAALQGRRRRRRSRPASTRCGWSSPTTAAASARAAPSTLYVDGDQVGEGRVDATVPMIFSGDETTDVGTRHRHARSATTTTCGESALHAAASAGSRSTSATTPRTPTT